MENFNLGQTIRDLRNEHHYSQSQLGNLLNVTDSTVSKWESGDSNPGIEQIHAMANLFKMTVDAFLHYQEAKNAERLKREVEERAQVEAKNRAVKEKLSERIFIKAWDQQKGFCDEARITVEYDGTTLTLHQKENPNIVLYDSCIGTDLNLPCTCSAFRDGKWESCPVFEEYKDRWRILFDFSHPIERIRFSFDDHDIEDFEFCVKYVEADKAAYDKKKRRKTERNSSNPSTSKYLKNTFPVVNTGL